MGPFKNYVGQNTDCSYQLKDITIFRVVDNNIIACFLWKMHQELRYAKCSFNRREWDFVKEKYFKDASEYKLMNL